MGAIKDRSKVQLEDAILFSRVDREECDFFILSLVLDGIKEAADNICNNKFIKVDDCGCPILDEDGKEQEEEIPATVEKWILRRFAREVQYPISGNNESSEAEIGSIKLDKKDWAELLPAINFNAKSRKFKNSESNLSINFEQWDYWCY